eukprot:TRINITY_DN1081_c0_g1_i1.p1 TRINITY_DN1081_c0_g1~~TRINITY_DN1081_c0_g1_i1.p1  ORF type:complete len:420 (-),score=61.73 TRINITY_DN1081_c0_g1_i1:162-1421(-)
MVFLRVFALLIGTAVIRSVVGQIGSQVTCSNIGQNVCRTGICKYGGITSTWAIPYSAAVEGGSCNTNPQYGQCLVQGTFKDPTSTYLYYVNVVATPAKCCSLCRTGGSGAAAGMPCMYWMYRTLYGTPAYAVSSMNGGYCYLYVKNSVGYITPTCNSTVNMATSVGSKCVNGVNDPHFTGATGRHFDFNGWPGKTFCLISDTQLHINMKMTGYLDSRTDGATMIWKGKAVRTWMKELGFKWMEGGEDHTLRLLARSGKDYARGEGFLELIEADGEVIPRMQEGNELFLKGGLSLKMVGVEKDGPFLIDVYTVRIGLLLNMDVRVRIATPWLQTKDDAIVHLNFGINDIKSTPRIHGVLGQTYGPIRTKRPEGADMKVDGPFSTPRNLLEGSPGDYVSSGILETDCEFSSYRITALVEEF